MNTSTHVALVLYLFKSVCGCVCKHALPTLDRCVSLSLSIQGNIELVLTEEQDSSVDQVVQV